MGIRELTLILRSGMAEIIEQCEDANIGGMLGLTPEYHEAICVVLDDLAIMLLD
jgi:hypothetical protein